MNKLATGAEYLPAGDVLASSGAQSESAWSSVIAARREHATVAGTSRAASRAADGGSQFQTTSGDSNVDLVERIDIPDLSFRQVQLVV